MPSDENPDPFDDFVTSLHATARQVFSGMSAVYGLTGFEHGPLALGEWAVTDDRSDRVGLVYGNVAGDGIVQVHTTTGSPQAALDSLRYGDGDRAEGLTEPGDDDEMPWFNRWERTSPSDDVSLPVGGVDVVFSRRSNGDAWYAWAALPTGDCGLIIEAVHVRPDELAIAEITDIEPYVSGHRLVLQAAWGR